MKKSGVLLVTLTGVNHRVWSHLKELSGNEISSVAISLVTLAKYKNTFKLKETWK